VDLRYNSGGLVVCSFLYF